MDSTKEFETNSINYLSELVDLAKSSGADKADGIAIYSSSLSVSQRLGKREDLERAESENIGLRVFIGNKQAIVSSTKHAIKKPKELVDSAISMAKVTPEDPFASLAEIDTIATSWPKLKLLDKYEPSPEDLYSMSSEAENAALSIDKITNSEGAEASWSKSTVSLVTSEGFRGAYSGSSSALSVSVIAGEDTNMERDYDYSISRFFSKLTSPKDLGVSAANRTIKKLNPKKIKSTKMPIIYDWRVASSILNHFINAINGQSVARKTSFLKEKLNQQVFSKDINIFDNPHIISGLSSKPFDGEGSKNKLMQLVSKGTLNSWILDTSSAKQLNLKSTGHASRGIGSPPSPSPSNLYIDKGNHSVSELIDSVNECLLVTELIGMGVNSVTGDYSRGASGFLISKGEIIHPVNEITIAGNLNEMFKNITPANDLQFRFGSNSPTLLVNGMTIAGT
ncbi:metallopeptidase TldD-related protein [Alphaproteobacteria bacterium]|nr:metallopeptidase TldD-related protein [Alphaproteobacteria bacterium]